MDKINSFNVFVDTTEPVVCVHLDFYTTSRKTLNEAINLLVAARDKLQDIRIREDEEGD